ncbi:hypothetical protein Clacol_005291 [Clathrus columnatus]|uniref:Uncharacterized protein n=1 Tax=Clathrus columnatus TaxID=1419009 RepID=A0AAV5ADR5_9AGAM|nr:hypothetical protein Clacol_005291 [Clathrus columnatus]
MLYSSDRKLYVAHFGHEKLKGARHWALILMKNRRSGKEYQIEGSTITYSYLPPEKNVKPLTISTFLGMTEVGVIPNKRRDEFKQILATVPVVLGDLQWNCQNWVIDAMSTLRKAGFNVQDSSHDELLKRLDALRRKRRISLFSKFRSKQNFKIMSTAMG